MQFCYRFHLWTLFLALGSRCVSMGLIPQFRNCGKVGGRRRNGGSDILRPRGSRFIDRWLKYWHGQYDSSRMAASYLTIVRSMPTVPRCSDHCLSASAVGSFILERTDLGTSVYDRCTSFGVGEKRKWLGCRTLADRRGRAGLARGQDSAHWVEA